MKKFAIITLGALATVACAANMPLADNRLAEPSRDERRALSLLEGKVSERPVPCVNQRDLGNSHSLPNGDLLFESRSSRLVYLNQPVAGCPSTNFGRSLITRTPSTRLCRGDIVQVVDLTSGVPSGSCGLGDFTPYRRVG